MTAEEYVVSELNKAKEELETLKSNYAKVTTALKAEHQKLEKLISIIPWKVNETESGKFVYIESIFNDCDVDALIPMFFLSTTEAPGISPPDSMIFLISVLFSVGSL